MSAQQRPYRPPTSTPGHASLDGRGRLNVTNSNRRDRDEAQQSTPAQQSIYYPLEGRPMLADHTVNSVPHELPEAQRTNSQRSTFDLLAATTRISLADRLERFNIASPSTYELSEFKKSLDQECLLRSLHPNAHSTVSTGTVVQITLYLSGQLLQWSDAESGMFRDLQLRALVAALALLHHSGLTELTAEPHDQLRLNIAARFNDIIDGRRASRTTLQDRMRKADALYLIRLAAQYFSLIKRAQPLSDAVPIPIIGLVLAGASIASGQYSGLSSVFHHADKIICLMPGRETPHLNLPAIQELIRNATTILSFAATSENGEIDVKEKETALEVVQLVQQLLKVHIHNIPSRRSSVWDWPLARLRRGPPLMDKWYFFYGLLDCLAQVARHAGPGQLSTELLALLKQLMEESEYEELRWKILEIFEAYEPLRRGIHQWFRARFASPSIDSAGVLLELAAVGLNSRQRVLTSVEAVIPRSQQTTSSSGMDNHLVLSGDPSSLTQATENRPLYPALVGTQYIGDGMNTHAEDVDAIGQLPMMQESVLTRSTDEQGRSLSLASQQQGHTPATEESEEDEQYLEGHLDYWTQDGNTQESQLLPQGIFGKGLRGYAHAGLSPDCRLAFFSSPRDVCVARVSLDSRRRRKEDLVLERKYDKRSHITDVSLLNNILAVSTYKNLELHRLGNAGPGVTVSHGDWDPLGTASWEQGLEAMIAVGLRRGAGNSRVGRIVVHQVNSPPAGPLHRKTLCEFKLPKGESPKFLAFDAGGKNLACITDRNVGNSVIIWKIAGVPEDGNPTVINRHHHRPETDSDGLTAAVLYRSPAQQSYVLCTTSASTERYRSRGEWCFTSPIAPANGQVPSCTVHDLTALQDHRQIVAGTASSVANKVVVLTKAGKVLILSLDGHEEGGVCSLENAPGILPVSLCALKSSRATPTCLRFDPAGTKLYAVDPEGKVIVLMFRSET
ncbi:MAG: hypothetical protein Q9221_007687 [Calogaya cf. arnoldii]